MTATATIVMGVMQPALSSQDTPVADLQVTAAVVATAPLVEPSFAMIQEIRTEMVVTPPAASKPDTSVQERRVAALQSGAHRRTSRYSHPASSLRET